MEQIYATYRTTGRSPAKLRQKESIRHFQVIFLYKNNYNKDLLLIFYDYESMIYQQVQDQPGDGKRIRNGTK